MLTPPHPTVRITRKGVDRWKAGHPWIYAADVEPVPATLTGGEVVRVEDHRGWFMGQAFYSRDSKISLRWLSWDDVPVDREFWKARLIAAEALRKRACPDETTYRVVHGEADLLPGLGDGWLELLEADLRSLVAGTPFEGATLVQVSAKSGEGLDTLKTEIDRLADHKRKLLTVSVP